MPSTPTALESFPTDTAATDAIAAALIAYLETGVAAPGLFAPDVFCDFAMPTWRIQAEGIADVLALRRAGHPEPSRVPRHRLDRTARGFVLDLEETWVDAAGAQWYCRELIRADVTAEGIVDIAVHCTGDWDQARVAEHAAAGQLLRP